MGINELKESVNGIRMKEEMRRAVIENVEKRTGQSVREQMHQNRSDEIQENRRKGRKDQGNGYAERSAALKTGKRKKSDMPGWKRNLAAAALVIVAVGMAAVPVRAFVNSIVKERMEEMPQEEKDDYAETVKEQKVEADGYSRAYTENEETRYQEMADKYLQGTFPEQAVIQVDSEEEAASYEFCFLKPTSTFCLPERELTDEELLQIIDFIAKRDYAYREDYAREHAQEITAKEEQEKAEIDRNVESGGITEQQAIEIATRKLSEIYDMTGDGFERNSYYEEREDEHMAIYCVSWSNIISHRYYYFYIDAKDGHMRWADYSGEDVRDAPSVTVEEAKVRIPELRAEAARCMENIVGEPYSKVYVYYLEYTDGSAGGSVRFYFAGEDQSAYAVTYTWSGILHGIEEKDISGLEDGMERELWTGDEYIKTNVVFRELSE